jgi:hypothetical protein
MERTLFEKHTVLGKVFSISFVLGTIFIISGIGKILSFQGFIETIISITHYPRTITMILGLVIIGFELAGGFALICHYRIKLFILLFIIVIGLFIFVLTNVIVAHKNVICHCFGLFDFGLSNYHELLFDVLLLDILVFYGIVHSSTETFLKERKFFAALVLAVILFAEYSVLQPLSKLQNEGGGTNVREIVSFLETQTKDFPSVDNRVTLIVLINFTDLSCPPCFGSFIMLTDLLRKRSSNRIHAIGIMKEDDLMNRAAPQRLTHWKDANNIDIPMVIAPDSLFWKMHNEKSAVLLLDSRSRILFLKTLPLSQDQVTTVLSIMD